MPDTVTPRAWIGCLACYNAGRLTGKWVDLDDTYDAEEITPEFIHDKATSHEELWVMDSEHVPVSGEFGLQTCTEIAEAYTDLVDRHSAEQWPAFLALAKTGTYGYGTNSEIPTDFEDRFVTAHDGTFRDWVMSEDGPDPFEEYTSVPLKPFEEPSSRYIPEDSPIRQFFDWQRYADELERFGGYSTEYIDGTTYIFRDL